MALPVKTTAEDVRDVVRYLKTKPTGASIKEAQAVNKRLMDGRKVSAYVAWGVVVREDNRLRLTERGQTMARRPDQEQVMFRAVLDAGSAYRSVLDWANHQELASITADDVAAHLHDHHRDTIGDSAKDATLRENAICFFSLAEAAGFGTMKIGRGGNATRLEIARHELTSHIEHGPAAPAFPQPMPEASPQESGDDPDAVDNVVDLDFAGRTTTLPEVEETTRVFISHGSNKDVVEQIETMLALGDFESEVAVKEETAAIPVPDKVFEAMRRCQAGIIAVTVDEGRRDDAGSYVLNENVLIEIGAAFVLYDRRVVLLWDKRLDVPSNLQGLYRCEFEGDELSWTAGMKLMKAIREFKRPKAA
jgi:hypothetical protein